MKNLTTRYQHGNGSSEASFQRVTRGGSGRRWRGAPALTLSSKEELRDVDQVDAGTRSQPRLHLARWTSPLNCADLALRVSVR